MYKEVPCLEYLVDIANREDDTRVFIGAMVGVNDKIEEAKQKPKQNESNEKHHEIPTDLVTDIKSIMEGKAISNTVNQAKKLENALKERMQEGREVKSAEITDDGYKIKDRADEERE